MGCGTKTTLIMILLCSRFAASRRGIRPHTALQVRAAPRGTPKTLSDVFWGLPCTVSSFQSALFSNSAGKCCDQVMSRLGDVLRRRSRACSRESGDSRYCAGRSTRTIATSFRRRIVGRIICTPIPNPVSPRMRFSPQQASFSMMSKRLPVRQAINFLSVRSRVWFQTNRCRTTILAIERTWKSTAAMPRHNGAMMNRIQSPKYPGSCSRNPE